MNLSRPLRNATVEALDERPGIVFLGKSTATGSRFRFNLKRVLHGSAKPSRYFWCLLLVIMAGCRSSGNRFDARQSSAELKSKEPPTVFTHKLFQLDNQAFTAVEMTNRVRQEWLKPPSGLFALGPGDGIEIEAIGEPNARSTAMVGPDGKIYYGLLPGTLVWGLTLS